MDIMNSQNKKTENEVVLFAKINKEKNDKKRIECNLIISGLKEPISPNKEDKDKEQIEAVLSKIGIDSTHIKRNVRLTKKNKAEIA